MKCEKCEMDTDAGEYYSYYNCTVSRHTELSLIGKKKITDYTIKDSTSVFLCDRCVAEEIIQRLNPTSGRITFILLMLLAAGYTIYFAGGTLLTAGGTLWEYLKSKAINDLIIGAMSVATGALCACPGLCFFLILLFVYRERMGRLERIRRGDQSVISRAKQGSIKLDDGTRTTYQNIGDQLAIKIRGGMPADPDIFIISRYTPDGSKLVKLTRDQYSKLPKNKLLPF
jgi:hypothetical protein